ncbi:carbohydrate binding domain-containing protein [Moheibacter lacus]|uniref:PKD/Chitinase domain-containing protein n=1 Tax=Moheibacter lacus TaxID=2745851 RepID=A0A838ZMD2_9FLAO|nr:hypothetical protein [Moheibacter lacus]MBA5629684.1 hypothetical protein [Moheibacter lacus]
MKNIFKILSIFIIPLLFGCSDDDGLTDVDNGAPVNLAMDFTITQDNSGLVTILPTGENANAFQVDFGDGSELSEKFAPGGSLEHIYPEGSYEVKLIATNLSGDQTEYVQTLDVSFAAPENLVVTITRDSVNPFIVQVQAEADFETNFLVYFGETTPEDPISILEGETATHEYQNIGTYTITVIAQSGGTQTTTYTEEIQIFHPMGLPVTFENPDLNYLFYTFGGGEPVLPIIDNPAPNGVNNSAKVAEYTKPAGSETWAGTVLTLNESIDFSTSNKLSVDVYSPAAGTPVLLKLEDHTNPDIFVETIVNTTTSGQWERLVFEMAIDPTQSYTNVVLFFNFNVSGAGETYYFDNIQKVPMALPLDFEVFAPEDYVFTGFGGAGSAVELNPFVDGTNPSEHVVKGNKGMNAETWAGTFINLDQAVDFSQGSKISMKFRSPQAGVTVLVKFENPDDATLFVEAPAVTTVADGWETIEADFTGMPLGNWKRLVVFYDFGNPGTGTDYYFDDVEQVN